MELRKAFVAVSLTGALATGCSSSPEQLPAQQESLPAPTTQPEEQYPGQDLTFSPEPKYSFSVADCFRQPDSWAVVTDSEPEDVEDYDRTVGLRAGTNADGSPVMKIGATVLGVGNYHYQIALSDAAPDSGAQLVDLANESFSAVIQGTEGYSAVFSAYQGNDNQAYFRINCLPEHGFHGSQKSVPLDEVPQVSPTTPPPPPKELSV